MAEEEKKINNSTYHSPVINLAHPYVKALPCFVINEIEQTIVQACALHVHVTLKTFNTLIMDPTATYKTTTTDSTG